MKRSNNKNVEMWIKKIRKKRRKKTDEKEIEKE